MEDVFMENIMYEYFSLKRREGVVPVQGLMELLNGVKEFNETGYLVEEDSNYDYLKELVIQSPQKKKEIIYKVLKNLSETKESMFHENFVQFLMKIVEP